MSHSGKDLIEILETYPRDELFQTPVDELAAILTRCCTCRSAASCGCSCARTPTAATCRAWSTCRATATPRRCAADAGDPRRGARRLETASASTTPPGSASRCSPGCTSWCGRRAASCARGRRRLLEQRLAEATRSWADDFSQARLELRGEADGARLCATTATRSPRRTRRTSAPRIAVTDMRRLEALDPDDAVGLHLYEPADAPPGEGRFKIFRPGDAAVADPVLPLFSHGGRGRRRAAVRADHAAGRRCQRVDLRLRPALRRRARRARRGRCFQEAFLACWRGRPRPTGSTGWCWPRGCRGARSACCVRTQASSARSARRSARPTSRTPCCGTARHPVLVELFRPVRPGCQRPPGRPRVAHRKVSDVTERITAALDDVASLDQDRILRSLRRAIDATLRTNYFVPDADGADRSYVSFKFEPQRCATCRDRGRGSRFRLLPAGRGRAPALRPGGARRAALVGPPRGLPHRGARPGEGADGEERRDRAGRRQGRLLLQAAARPGGRPRRVARRGGRLLPHVHLGLLDITDNLRRRAGRAAGAGRAPRRRRPVPRRRGRQGHGDVLRHRQRDRARATASGSATRSRRAGRPATTTRRWASPRAAPGSR